MFQESKDGQTHSFNDGCGEPAHNCSTCQFENGEHSQACPKYVEQKLEEVGKKYDRAIKRLGGGWENDLAELLDENSPVKVRDFVRQKMEEALWKGYKEGVNVQIDKKYLNQEELDKIISILKKK